MARGTSDEGRGLRGAVAQPVARGPQPTDDRNPWVILAVLCLAVFMLLLDTTIINVAQVKIKEGLGANLTQIQWVFDSYILTYAVLLLSFGRMGDVFGRKRVFLIGMAIFTLASGLCGASDWLGGQLGVSGANALIFARVMQGFGGALMMPQSLSLLQTAFPPEKRGAAMGIWGSIIGLGAIAGPIIGGLIVTDYAWEWAFLINLPIGAVALLATWLIVPESKDPQASPRLDWGGLALSGVGLFGVIYALIEGNREGWTAPVIVGSFLGGLALLAAFVWWERRADDPMMKIELFKLRNFWVANVITLLVAFGMFGIFFPLTLFLQGVLGFTPIRAGLTTVPMSFGMLVLAPITGRLSDRIGARWLLVGGLSLMSTGIVLTIIQSNLEADWLALLPALLVAGAGMGMTMAPMTAAAMREVPPRIAGSASGIYNNSRNIGQVLGIAVLGSVLQSRMAGHTRDRLADAPLDPATREQVVQLAKDSRFPEIAALVPDPQILHSVSLAFVDSLHNTFLIGAVTCALGAGVALLIHNPRRAEVATAPPADVAVAEEVAAD